MASCINSQDFLDRGVGKLYYVAVLLAVMSSAFYGKSSVYVMVAKNAVAWQLLPNCGDSPDLEEEVVEKLFKFT